MRVYGTAAIADLLGDFVAYRNLCPADPRLPNAPTLRQHLNIPSNQALRKGDNDYARIVAAILQAANALDTSGSMLHRLIMIGDTRTSDGETFISLCDVAGWEGRAFIGQDVCTDAPNSSREGAITFANRWSTLHAFASALEAEQFIVDCQTAVVIDLDKTLYGARGRNHQLIDEARLAALRASGADMLGTAFNPASFEQIYRAINQSRFHPLTADNQDYVAYICVIINSGALALEELIDLFESGQVPQFDALLAMLDQRARWPSSQIAAFHTQIARRVAAGDPTPFKTFRYHEYAETIARMGCCLDDTPPDVLLHTELVLTAEVWHVVKEWQKRGALLFGLSDKPDEAAMPNGNADTVPLHHRKTHIVGE